MRRRSAPLLPLLLLVALPLPAAGWTLELDPSQSTVRFTFGATLHTVDGTMAIEQGTFRLDPATRAASGSVYIDTTTASTGNARRDRKMHEKILETRRFPRAVFTLERLDGTFEPAGSSELLMHGTLVFHGDKHQMLIPAKVRVEGERLTGRCQVTIPYIEWGLDDPSFLLLRVGKTVDVNIEVVGRLTQ
jgi:polyisoprenoid-binding protein YceI